MTEAEVEAVARAMFESDERSREAVAKIRHMPWDTVGSQYRNIWRERARAAIAASRAALTAEGKRVVLIEPTEEMIDIGYDAAPVASDPATTYRAMVKASPDV